MPMALAKQRPKRSVDQIYTCVDLQSEKARLYLSMPPPQRTGRMDAVAANGYIFWKICNNICGTSQKSLCGCQKATAVNYLKMGIGSQTATIGRLLTRKRRDWDIGQRKGEGHL